MKIGLVTKNFSIERGGLEKYAFSLSRELVRAGHEVHVFANNWQTDSDVTFHKVPMIPFTLPLKNLSFAYFANQQLRRVALDVIHSMERILYQDIYRASDGIIPIHLSQRYPNPIVRGFKSIGPRRLALRYLERRIFSGGGCKIIMTNSQLVKGHIIDHYKIALDKIAVVYNAVDTSRFHPGVKETYGLFVRDRYGLKEDELVLLFISNDFKRKSLRAVLEAISLLGKREIRLLVVGDDNTKPYQKWAANNALDSQILFLGPRKDVERYYAAADIFVLPTLYDAFANVCLEAMACGLPVITTQTNGAAELIQDGEHGFVLKSRKPLELADRIADLGCLKERSRIGNNAAIKAKEFTMEKHISELLRLYRRVMTNKVV